MTKPKKSILITKVPLYFQVEIEGDFDPVILNDFANTFLSKVCFKTIEGNPEIPYSSTDLKNNPTRVFCETHGVKHLKISHISKEKVIRSLQKGK